MNRSQLIKAMLVPLFCLAPGVLLAEDVKDPCPWVPRNGKWKLTAGKMSVGGIWTPLGGGAMTVTVTVHDCGDKIQMDSTDVGTVVFRLQEGGFRLAADKIPIQLKGPRQWYKSTVDGLRYELSPEVGAIVWDTPEAQMAEAAVSQDGYKQDELQKPPETLNLFETNVYKADFRPGVAWYLDYINQFEMYSVTTTQGATVTAPVHQQFHHWTYSGK